MKILSFKGKFPFGIPQSAKEARGKSIKFLPLIMLIETECVPVCVSTCSNVPICAATVLCPKPRFMSCQAVSMMSVS